MQRIPDDGNCIPRAALTAAGRSSADGDVVNLRTAVLKAMAADRERCDASSRARGGSVGQRVAALQCRMERHVPGGSEQNSYRGDSVALC